MSVERKKVSVMLWKKFVVAGLMAAPFFAVPSQAVAQTVETATRDPNSKSIRPVSYNLGTQSTRAIIARDIPASQALMSSAVEDRMMNEWRGLQASANRWEAAYLVLSAVDAVQTIECLSRNEDPCEESNPLLGKSPSAGEVVLLKSGLGLVQYLAFRHINKRSPKTALRFAQFGAVLQGGVVLLNVKSAF